MVLLITSTAFSSVMRAQPELLLGVNPQITCNLMAIAILELAHCKNTWEFFDVALTLRSNLKYVERVHDKANRKAMTWDCARSSHIHLLLEFMHKVWFGTCRLGSSCGIDSPHQAYRFLGHLRASSCLCINVHVFFFQLRNPCLLDGFFHYLNTQ